jgi:hypothetical protein
MHKQQHFLCGTSMWVLIYVIYLFLAMMHAMYMLSVYNKKIRSHRITILLSFQFLVMLFSSHNKKLFGKYPWALGPLDRR